MDDKKLISRLRRGDTDALSALINIYSPYVYAIASNLLSPSMSPEDIEEVAADSFIALWENRDRITGKSAKPYLAAVTRNKARDALRSRHLEEPLEDNILELSLPNEPEKRLLLSDLRQAARRAVYAMGQPDREIFQRYYFLFQKTETIAAQMGLNSATVRTRLARGRRRLKDQLTERGYSYADTNF